MNEYHALAVIAVNITTWFEVVTVSVRAMVFFFDEESATFTRHALPDLIDEFTHLEPLTYLVLLSLRHSSLYNSTACEDNKAQAVEGFNVYILVGRGQI